MFYIKSSVFPFSCWLPYFGRKERILTISEQRVRVRGGRSAARGATVRFAMRQKTEKIVKDIDCPKLTPKVRKPSRYDVDYLITQAHEAMVNFPDSVAARKRYDGLVAYRKENF
jgi:hypothetical protein